MMDLNNFLSTTIAAILIIVCQSHAAPKRETGGCVKDLACPQIYKPVCGSNGKTYGNMCLLKVAACKVNYDKLKLDYDGECEESEPCSFQYKICTKIYRPVCGSNGKTYNNKCLLKTAACKANDHKLVIAAEGECKDKSEPCFEVCALKFKPVCASDGKTYPNECFMKMAACKTNDNTLVVDHHGKCKAGCKKDCKGKNKPVCGSDGKTYSSLCHLKVKACNDGNESLTVKAYRPCLMDENQGPKRNKL